MVKATGRTAKWCLGLVLAAVVATALAMHWERALHGVLEARLRLAGVESRRGESAGIHGSWYEAGSGGGTAVLLLHGAGGDALSSWYRLLPALAAEHRVIAPELGFLSPSVEPAADAVGLEMNRLRAVLDAADCRRVFVVGLSVGAWLGLRLASEDPGTVAGVVAVAPAGPNLRDLPGRVAASGMEPGRWFSENLFHSPPPLAALFLKQQYPVVDRWVRDLPRYADGLDIAGIGPDAMLRGVRCPVTLVWGREDRILPPEDRHYYEHHLKRVKTVLLDDCGHAVVWDRPDALEALVRGALAEAAP